MKRSLAGEGPGRQAPERLPVRRQVAHATLIVLGWVLFAWSWQRVTAARPEAGELRVLMLGALVLVPVLTLGWVMHNLGIYRRKGPRRSVRQTDRPYRQDFNGRRIDADWAALGTARRVVIELDGDAKRYAAGEPRGEVSGPRSVPVRAGAR